jgi:hypothetical protein
MTIISRLDPMHGRQRSLTKPTNGWVRFWFTPVDPLGLGVLRTLAGLVFLGWLLSYAGAVDSLFGQQGWLDRKAYEESARLPDGQLPTNWSILSRAGPEGRGLGALYWSSIVVVALFTCGVLPRVTSVLNWIVVASFTVNPLIEYDAHALLNPLAFYLMLGHVLRGWSRGPSIGVNVALRLLQVHLAIIMVVSGLHKLQFGDWWSGVAYWYPLHPPFETTVASARVHAANMETYLGFLSAAAYVTLAWQLGFPLFAWRQRWWRLVLIGGAAVAWVGTGWLYGIPWFGPALFVGCLSYLTPGEWRVAQSGLARLFRRNRSLAGAGEPAKGTMNASLVVVGHKG